MNKNNKKIFLVKINKRNINNYSLFYFFRINKIDINYFINNQIIKKTSNFSKHI